MRRSPGSLRRGSSLNRFRSSSVMHDDLIGYFLGALDRDAVERVESELAENPRLREELDRIGRALRPLGGKDEVVAPSGLAERTIQRVLRQRLSELWTPSAPSRWRA